MSFTESLKHCINNRTNFKGRASLSEFWYFFLVNLIILTYFCVVDATGPVFSRTIVLQIIFPVAIFLPNLAVSVRRLHDIGKSGWYLFLCLIPVIGLIWLFILFATASQQEENEYGPIPEK